MVIQVYLPSHISLHRLTNLYLGSVDLITSTFPSYIQPSSSGTNSASVNGVSKAGLRLILILVPSIFLLWMVKRWNVDGFMFELVCQFWCKQIIGLNFLEFGKN